MSDKKNKQVHDFGCAMLFFDNSELKNIHSQIEDEDICKFHDGKALGLENEPHLTLLYGLHEGVADNEVFGSIEDNKIPQTMELNNVSLFENENYDVLKFDCGEIALTDINSNLRNLPHTNSFPDYHAHSTIGYLKSGKGKKYVEKFKGLKMNVEPNKIVYSKPDGTKPHKMLKGGSFGDTIDMDVPLFIRMLEFAKEDANNDLELHKATENAISLLKSKKELTMDDYKEIVAVKEKLAKGGKLEGWEDSKLEKLKVELEKLKLDGTEREIKIKEGQIKNLTKYISNRTEKYYKGGNVKSYEIFKSINWDAIVFGKKLSKIYRLVHWIEDERIDLNKVPAEFKEKLIAIHDSFVDTFNLEYRLSAYLNDTIESIERYFEKEIDNAKKTDKYLKVDKYDTEVLKEHNIVIPITRKKTTEQKIRKELKISDDKYVITTDELHTINSEKISDRIAKEIVENKGKEDLLLSYFKDKNAYSELEYMVDYELDEIVDTYDELLRDYPNAVFTEEEEESQIDMFAEPKEEIKEKSRDEKFKDKLKGIQEETVKEEIEKSVKWTKKKIFDNDHNTTYEYSNGTDTFIVHKDKKELSTSVVKPDGKNVRIVKTTWRDLTSAIIKSKGTPKEEVKVEKIENNDSNLIEEINTELEILNDLLDDAKEDGEKDLVLELEDRIEFLEELKEDSEVESFEKGGSIDDFSKIIIIFNDKYDFTRLDFYGISKDNSKKHIGWSDSKLYLPSTKVLNLQRINLISEYDNSENFKKVVSLIKSNFKKETSKTELRINNSSY